MDLLKEIKDKIKSNAELNGGRGIESVLAHIEIAERHHLRAKKERDEHLYTDVIYRTNHAFEGILKEAYITLADKPADKLTPFEIETYLLDSNILRGRVVDLLTNYRQNWRNPSTHDYQLFFSEQESFLAIITVSAFASILLDQMIEKIAYNAKYAELDNIIKLARDNIKDFSTLPPLLKVSSVLFSYAKHYINNFSSMSASIMSTANAQMAAFIKKVAPELDVELEMAAGIVGQQLQFDIVVRDNDEIVVIETREPRSQDEYEANFDDEAAVNQLARRLYEAGLKSGVVFFYPGHSEDIVVATTSSTSWPKDLNLQMIYSDDPAKYPDEDYEEPMSLVYE
jgi:hypothetical protein